MELTYDYLVGGRQLTGNTDADCQEEQTMLKEFGAQGWKLVMITQPITQEHWLRYYFTRIRKSDANSQRKP